MILRLTLYFTFTRMFFESERGARNFLLIRNWYLKRMTFFSISLMALSFIEVFSLIRNWLHFGLVNLNIDINCIFFLRTILARRWIVTCYSLFLVSRMWCVLHCFVWLKLKLLQVYLPVVRRLQIDFWLRRVFHGCVRELRLRLRSIGLITIACIQSLTRSRQATNVTVHFDFLLNFLKFRNTLINHMAVDDVIEVLFAQDGLDH